ncbi:T9SS type A sorting domain-containing protein [Brumimicrobium glaciale]|uniref:T9SS type A sorting domain-containing protein n=1 Tax=Brumimicrobium glaciale TaxID=200475 RepID=A0A4Q4KLP1_9FLAO|nr:T9SS type A sorting domain-containing protein [Brumimicrobium glaciale]RYM33880.1 T9SS type A sorting domain-containing protein [Brumimicrobium glaciale]
MKNLFYILLIFVSFPLHSQWITIKGENYHNHSAFNHFSIDPYTNNIWLVSPFLASVFEPNGTVITFGENELGDREPGDEFNFGFTEGHTFFTKNIYGLFSFDNYQKQLLYSSVSFNEITTDKDTLFITGISGYVLKYRLISGIENTNLNATQCAAKNGFLYTNRGSYFYVDNNGIDSPIWQDSFSLGAPTDLMEFDNETDTVFLGFNNGITKFYDGIGYDTITPNNTTNMPSPNILEIEFDKDNNLWVAFGDVNDDFIALGKLENSDWSEVYTAANSPINFDEFYGFEFDTLGNIWVASGKDLHTLENSNSPAWLSNIEYAMDEPQISVYPNPASDALNIQLPASVQKAEVLIGDINGKVVLKQILNSQGINSINIEKLEKGIYILNVIAEDNQWQEKFIKK